MTGKTPIYATFPEKLAIKALLDERLHPVEATDHFRYEDGWSDEVVAKTVREALSANVAAKVRNECFGKLHNHGRTARSIVRAGTKARLERLEKRFERHLDWEQSLGGLTNAERAEIMGDEADSA